MFWSNNGILSIESEREVEGCGEGAVVPPFFFLWQHFSAKQNNFKKKPQQFIIKDNKAFT